jgi:hypothetical protein
MKLMHPVFITILSTLAVFSAVTYTACKKDKCSNVICFNLGACDNGTCLCPVGYEGDRCQTKSRDKFIKTFNGWDTCDNRAYTQYPIHFTALLGNPLQLTMKNIFNVETDSAVCTMQSIDSFVFQGANNASNYRGTGKLRNDSLTLRYHFERDTSYYDCVYHGLGLK